MGNGLAKLVEIVLGLPLLLFHEVNDCLFLFLAHAFLLD
jgi:hypothetical protein